MFIIAIRSPTLFVRLVSNAILSRFFIFRTDELPNLREPKSASRIYSLFRVKDGTSKQTAPGRFKDLDLITVELLAKGTHHIHDIAVSSGITTSELYATLKQNSIDFQLYASDKFSKFFYKGRLIRKIYDQEKNFIYAYAFGILGDLQVSWKYPLSKALYYFAQAFDYSKQPFSEIPLYDYRLMELIHAKKVHDLTYDIFSTSMPNRFSFIRCMNILNLSYFKPELLSQGIQLLSESLQVGGILLVGRTRPDGVNTAGFYQKNADSSLRLLRELNGGSEIKNLILPS